MTFTNEMKEAALEANGWFRDLDTPGNWYDDPYDPEFSSVSMEWAFNELLRKSNLI